MTRSNSELEINKAQFSLEIRPRSSHGEEETKRDQSIDLRRVSLLIHIQVTMLRKIYLLSLFIGLVIGLVNGEVQMASERSIVNAVVGQDAQLKCQSAEFAKLADFCIFTRFVTDRKISNPTISHSFHRCVAAERIQWFELDCANKSCRLQACIA